MIYEHELDLAAAAAREAGIATERHFAIEEGRPGLRQKSPGHPVTDADIEANSVIHRMIRGVFPQDGWLSEETADTNERLAKERVWIIDPIDGTKEFVKGIPEYAISIALAVNGTAVVGVVYQPSRNLLFTAVRGEGASLNGEPLRALAPMRRPPRVLVSRTETVRGDWNPFASRFEFFPCGSIAYKLCRVAAGEFDGVATIKPRSEWDIAAGVLMVEEAGGRACDHRGDPIRFNYAHPVLDTGLIAGSDEFTSYTLRLMSSGEAGRGKGF